MWNQAPRHLPEYLIEGAALGAFMLSASVVSVLLEHPASPVRQAIASAFERHVLAGLAMGLTLASIVYSRPGRRSGAHLNPVMTLTFFRLGKIARVDAAGYVAAQFTGAIVSMLVIAAAARPWLADPSVDYVRTVPGELGTAAAFAAELAISFGMMLLVLTISNSRWRAFTGVAAACLVAVYIAFESPISGMSMNPARSAGPAVAAGMLQGLWIYLLAPAAGMFTAAELYVRRYGLQAVLCAKLHHDDRVPCPFICGFARGHATTSRDVDIASAPGVVVR